MQFECQSLDMLLGVILRYTFGLVLKQSICPRAGLVQGSVNKCIRTRGCSSPKRFMSCSRPRKRSNRHTYRLGKICALFLKLVVTSPSAEARALNARTPGHRKTQSMQSRLSASVYAPKFYKFWFGFFGPHKFLFGTVGKALSLPWVGPELNSFSSTHGQNPKKALRAVQRLIVVSPPS